MLPYVRKFNRKEKTINIKTRLLNKTMLLNKSQFKHKAKTAFNFLSRWLKRFNQFNTLKTGCQPISHASIHQVQDKSREKISGFFLESIIYVIAWVILKIRTDHFKNDLQKNSGKYSWQISTKKWNGSLTLDAAENSSPGAIVKSQSGHRKLEVSPVFTLWETVGVLANRALNIQWRPIISLPQKNSSSHSCKSSTGLPARVYHTHTRTREMVEETPSS